MASINNLALKAYKSFNGREGIGFSANLYYGTKKVAECLDEANGGEMMLHFIDNEAIPIIENIANRYFNKYPKTILSSCSSYTIIRELIEDLIEFMEDEKAFKSYCKQGYPVTVRCSYNKRTAPVESFNYTDEDKLIGYKMWNEQVLKSFLAKYNPVEYSVYKSIDNFAIQV